MMQDEKFFEQVWDALKISTNDPAKLMEFIKCICDMELEGTAVSQKKIIQRLWPQKWQDATNKVLFEKGKWNLLRKRRLEINKRMLESDLCLSFYILLTSEKEFKTVWNAKEIYHYQLQELELALSKKRAAWEKKKIEDAILLLNQKFAPLGTPKGAPGVYKRKKVVLAWTAALFLVLAGFALLYRYNPFSAPHSANQPALKSPSTAKQEKISIAVLPFKNIDSDPDKAQLMEGVQEDIIAAFSRIPEIETTALSSTLRYRDRSADLKTVGKELGVRYVVEGNMRIDGDHVHVYAEISDTVKGHLVWEHKWLQPIDDIAKLKGDITMKVLANFLDKTGEGEIALVLSKGTQNVAAYAKLIEGYNLYLNRMKDIFLARQISQDAIALDHNYAAAYALLAMTYVRMVEYYGVSGMDEKALTAVQQALVLDDDNPVVHLAFSKVCWFRGEHDKALQEAEKAVAINPNFFETVNWQGIMLTWMGKYDQAINNLDKSVRMNPANPSISYLFLGYIYYEKGDYDLSAEYLKKNFQSRPDQLESSVFLAACYVAKGDLKDAREATARVIELDPEWRMETYFAKPFMSLKPANLEIFFDRLHLAGLS